MDYRGRETIDMLNWRHGHYYDPYNNAYLPNPPPMIVRGAVEVDYYTDEFLVTLPDGRQLRIPRYNLEADITINPPVQENPKMNYSTAVFLINKNARAIACNYEDEEEKKHHARTLFKTFDKSIAVGDYVTVPTDTRHKMTVVKVYAVDVDVDFDSSCQVAWIIGKVDKANYAEILKQEDEAIAAIKSAELLKKRRELAEAMFADNAEKIKALPIASTGNDAPASPAPDAAA